MDDRDERSSQPAWDPGILAAERDRPGPAAAQQEALLARLDRSLGAIAGADGASGAEASAGAPSAPSVPPNAASALRQKVLGVALTYVLGVATGALAHERLSRAPQDEPRAPAVAPREASDARPPGAMLDASVAVVRAAPDRDATAQIASDARPRIDAASARAPSARETTRDSNDLIAETNVIEMARSALARGRAAAALDALEQHRAQFARGQLAEDRESLAIEALVTLGRGDDARRRAEAFARRWPDGMYRPRVDAALALIR